MDTHKVDDVRRGWIVRFDGRIVYVAGVSRDAGLRSVLVRWVDGSGAWFSADAWRLNVGQILGRALDCHICNNPPTHCQWLGANLFRSECRACGSRAVFRLKR